MPNFRRISQLYRELADAYAEDDGQTYSDAADVNDWGSNDLPPDAPDDPWADDAQQSQPRQQPRHSGNSGQRQSQVNTSRRPQPEHTSGTFTDDRGKTWTFGRNPNKTCDHNMPAALVSGEKNGKTWKAWACPLGYGETWRDKCDMFDFTR